MAALTTAQEYQAVREAIQTLTTTGQQVASVNLDGMTITYNANQLTWLQARENELARRLTQRNIRKRVSPSYTSPATYCPDR